MGNGESKPVARLKNALTAGNIWLYALSLMKKEGKIYAYALPEHIENNFGFRPNRVMIYVVLYKLEAEGLIRAEFKERRKYYLLTEKGKAALDEGKKYLASLSERL